MIRYALACDAGHSFESWFPSAQSFEEQNTRGLVECPVCGSKQVDKQLMAPSVRTARVPPPLPVAPAAEAGTPPAPAPVAILSEKEQALRAMLKAVRDHVAKTSDYVGPNFAEEARKMHYGETEHRSIYGEARPADAQELMEEGIEIQALPPLFEDRN